MYVVKTIDQSSVRRRDPLYGNIDILVINLELRQCVRYNVHYNARIETIYFPIWPQYRYLLCKFPHSTPIRENTDQKKLRILTFFTQQEANL